MGTTSIILGSILYLIAGAFTFGYIREECLKLFKHHSDEAISFYSLMGATFFPVVLFLILISYPFKYLLNFLSIFSNFGRKTSQKISEKENIRVAIVNQATQVDSNELEEIIKELDSELEKRNLSE